MKSKDRVTIEELTRAVKIAARVVTLYGEVYLPIFNRVHAELEKAKQNRSETEIALDLARKIAEEENCH